MPIFYTIILILGFVVLCAGVGVVILLSVGLRQVSQYLPSYRQCGDWRIDWAPQMHQPLVFLRFRNGDISMVWEDAYVDICNGQVHSKLLGPGELWIRNRKETVSHLIRRNPATTK